MTIARTVVITLSTADASAAKLLEDVAPYRVMEPSVQLERICTLIKLLNGSMSCSAQVRVQTAGTCATGTVSASDVPSNNDTHTIFGVVFTYKTAPSPDDPLQVAIGATAAATMTNLLPALNRNARVMGVASAALITSTITLTARVPGKWAEAQGTLAKSGTNLAVSNPTLTASTEPTLSGANSVTAGYTPNTS